MMKFLRFDWKKLLVKAADRGNIILAMFALSAVAVLCLSIYTHFLFQSYIASEERLLMEKLKAVSMSAALLVDGDVLDSYRTVEDMELPGYKELRRTLRTFSERMNVLYVYYLRASGKMLQYIVDNDFDETTRVGLDTPPIDPSVDETGALDALSGDIGYMEAGEYRQYWSELVSAYAPVRDSRGEIVAAAGVDIKDTRIMSSRERMKSLTQIQILSLFFVLISGSVCLFKYRRMARLADAASKSKSSFLARMSHEIRTPLNAMIGFTEIQLQKALPGDVRDDMEKIYASGAGLLDLINDILDISKVESGEFDLVMADFSVSALISDVTQLNLVRIGPKKIDFRLEIDESIPETLRGDEVRVRQILNNFLSNAVKYTKEGGSVTFSISCERRGRDALVSFTVNDTGVGIKKSDMGKLFREYAQLNIGDRNIEGTGLGLFITKNLADMMGGSVSARSEYGKGSGFNALIPLGIVSEKPLGAAAAEDLRSFRFKANDRRRKARGLAYSDLSRGRALVVDDVRTNLDVARRLLSPYGLQIDCVPSGTEAIERIRASEKNGKKYDIVFMDHMMPEMDGIEATKKIRELGSEYARGVPIIALTANALSGNRKMFLDHGFSSFISKPIDIVQLNGELNRWVHEERDAEAEPRGAGDAMTALDVLKDVRLEGIDVESAVRRYGSEDVYLDVLRSYERHIPALLKKLEDGLSARDYATTVHGVKGATLGVGAEEIGVLAEELEQLSKAGDAESVKVKNERFVKKLRGLLDGVRDALSAARRSDDPGKKECLPSPDGTLLAKLLDEASSSDTYMMEQTLIQLENHEYGSGGELVRWLREQFDDLNYDAVKNRLENWLAEHA
ncbi:MAG: response regulator [Synergistaceae bacterium]|nr:response regulator [Synergistaceae bacterium]